MILDIVKYPDPRLLETAIKVSVFDSDLKALAEDMLETMYALRACGLAAPQVGIGIRLVVLNFGVHGVGHETQRVMVNPVIYHFGSKKATMGEMCVSCPEVVKPVERSKIVRARWAHLERWDRDGTCEETFRGWSARIVQHEVDHLDGKVIAT